MSFRNAIAAAAGAALIVSCVFFANSVFTSGPRPATTPTTGSADERDGRTVELAPDVGREARDRGAHIQDLGQEVGSDSPAETADLLESNTASVTYADPNYDPVKYRAQFEPVFERAAQHVRSYGEGSEERRRRKAFRYVRNAFATMYGAIGQVEPGNFMISLFYGNHHTVGSDAFGEAWQVFLDMNGVRLTQDDVAVFGELSITYSRSVDDAISSIDAELGITAETPLGDPIFDLAQDLRMQDLARIHADFFWDLEQRLTDDAYIELVALIDTLNVDNTEYVRN